MEIVRTKRWEVGDVVVTKVYESRLARDSIFSMLPIVDGDLDPYRSWMAPFLGPGDEMVMDVHAFCIEADGQRIVVDTCVGNDRHYESDLFASIFNGLHTTFLDDLSSVGFGPTSVDTVICTHLHPDHIGYNTVRTEAGWEPTFRNARYVMSLGDVEVWREGFTELGGPVADDSTLAFTTSVQPVVDAGQAELVEPEEFPVSPSVSLMATPGHTPDHFSVMIRSRGATALITGDAVHTPVQLARPEWSLNADADAEVSAQTRRSLVERFAGSDTLVMGTHFPDPTAGYIVADGAGWRFEGAR